MSYETFGVMHDLGPKRTSLAQKPVRKTMSSVNGYLHQEAALGLKGRVIGPSEIWLNLDADEGSVQNFPDWRDNHGSAGENVSFCDGHVAWVPRRTFVLQYEVSQDESRDTE